MGENVSNDLIYETVKMVPTGIVELRNGRADLRRDMRDLKDEAISTREEIQALRRDVLRQERAQASMQLDLDRVKSRLDLDNPPQ